MIFCLFELNDGNDFCFFLSGVILFLGNWSLNFPGNFFQRFLVSGLWLCCQKKKEKSLCLFWLCFENFY